MIAFLQPLIDALLAETAGEGQAAWTDGPTPIGSRATAQFPVDRYIGWIEEVEAGLPGRGPAEVIRRVRRMHYSKFSVKPPSVVTGEVSTTSQKIDELIRSNRDNPCLEPPLTTAHVSQTVLDGLYSTSSVLTAGGHSVDITHVFNAVDFAVNGRSFYGAGAELGAYLLPNYSSAGPELLFAAMVWLGDITTIWMEWTSRRLKAGLPVTIGAGDRASFEQVIADVCPLADLLGDLDGVAIATDPRVALQPLSTTLRGYYGSEAGAAALTANFPTSRQRFHYFAENSVPELLRRRLPGPGLRISFPAANVGIVRDLIHELIGVLYVRLEDHAEKNPEAHNPIFAEIANRFVFWIQQGVADPNGGVPAWPPPPQSVPR